MNRIQTTIDLFHSLVNSRLSSLWFQRRRRGGHDEALSPCIFERENGAEEAFHNNIIGYFMVYQDRFETNLLQLFVHPEDSEMVFYNFWYYFLGQHRCLTKRSRFGNNFLFFISFDYPQLFHWLPCPTAASGSQFNLTLFCRD